MSERAMYRGFGPKMEGQVGPWGELIALPVEVPGELCQLEQTLTSETTQGVATRLQVNLQTGTLEAGETFGDLHEIQNAPWLAGTRGVALWLPEQGGRIFLHSTPWHLATLQAELTASGTATAQLWTLNGQGSAQPSDETLQVRRWVRGDARPIPTGARVLVWQHAASRAWFAVVPSELSEGGGDGEGVAACPLIRFQLVEDLAAGSNGLAKKLQWNHDGYAATGDAFRVYDSTNHGNWLGKTGYFGWCVLNADSNRHEVVWMERIAERIEGTLGAAIVNNQAAATVNKYYRGVDPGTSLTVHDPKGFFSRARSGAKFLATWDDQSERYVLAQCELPAKVVVFRVGSQWHYKESPSFEATVVDSFQGQKLTQGSGIQVWNPPRTGNNPPYVFVGQPGAVGVAIYDEYTNQYWIDWVECPWSDQVGGNAPAPAVVTPFHYAVVKLASDLTTANDVVSCTWQKLIQGEAPLNVAAGTSLTVQNPLRENGGTVHVFSGYSGNPAIAAYDPGSGVFTLHYVHSEEPCTPPNLTQGSYGTGLKVPRITVNACKEISAIEEVDLQLMQGPPGPKGDTGDAGPAGLPVSIITGTDSGLSGGGLLDADRSPVVDIAGTTAGSNLTDAWQLLAHDPVNNVRRRITIKQIQQVPIAATFANAGFLNNLLWSYPLTGQNGIGLLENYDLVTSKRLTNGGTVATALASGRHGAVFAVSPNSGTLYRTSGSPGAGSQTFTYAWEQRVTDSSLGLSLPWILIDIPRSNNVYQTWYATNLSTTKNAFYERNLSAFGMGNNTFPTDGAWHFMVFSQDHSGLAGRFYMDGTLLFTVNSASSLVSTACEMYLGGDFPANARFNGMLRNFSYWGGRALTATEVGILNNSGTPLMAGG